MNLPDPKQLKKLADTCRKAGIIHFKSAEFEFTLTQETSPKVDKNRTKVNHGEQEQVESDLLSPEELLMWSAPDFAKETTES